MHSLSNLSNLPTPRTSNSITPPTLFPFHIHIHIHGSGGKYTPVRMLPSWLFMDFASFCQDKSEMEIHAARSIWSISWKSSRI